MKSILLILFSLFVFINTANCDYFTLACIDGKYYKVTHEENNKIFLLECDISIAECELERFKKLRKYRKFIKKPMDKKFYKETVKTHKQKIKQLKKELKYHKNIIKLTSDEM